MGFNTIALFANDEYNLFKKYPKETIENLLDGMNGGHKSYKGSYGLANHANPMKVMKTRHADDCSVYVYAGNTLCEMKTYNEETDDLMKNHPEFFERMLDMMESEMKRLKKSIKKLKINNQIVMKNILIILFIMFSISTYGQPNPKGNANGHNNPNNPNYDNPVPISGIEILITAGGILGIYSLYKKKKKC